MRNDQEFKTRVTYSRIFHKTSDEAKWQKLSYKQRKYYNDFKKFF